MFVFKILVKMVRSTDYGTGLLKIIFRWRGSVYKILYGELILYLSIYYAITCTARFALNEEQKKYFNELVIYSRQYQETLPVAISLVHYMTNIMRRWWGQYSGK